MKDKLSSKASKLKGSLGADNAWLQTEIDAKDREL